MKWTGRIPGYFALVLAALVVFSLQGSFRSLDNNGTEIRQTTTATTISKPLPPITFSAKDSTILQPRCLSFNESLVERISNTQQLFFLMPAKAAGTSLHEFALRCFGKGKSYPFDPFARDPSVLREFLTSNYELPQVVASHVSSANNLVNLMKHTTDDTLMVLLYRNEKDRLLSAIKHIVKSRMCGDWDDMGLAQHLLLNASSCVMDEATLVDEIIAQRPAEIAMGASGRLLNCKFYDTYMDTGPNLVFVDYRHANRLQELAAQKYCPDYLKRMATSKRNKNGDADKKAKAWVRLYNETVVSIDDWVRVKKEFLQLTLLLDKDASCQRQTKMIEKSLSECQDNLVELTL